MDALLASWMFNHVFTSCLLEVRFGLWPLERDENEDEVGPRIYLPQFRVRAAAVRVLRAESGSCIVHIYHHCFLASISKEVALDGLS